MVSTQQPHQYTPPAGPIPEVYSAGQARGHHPRGTGITPLGSQAHRFDAGFASGHAVGWISQYTQSPSHGVSGRHRSPQSRGLGVDASGGDGRGEEDRRIKKPPLGIGGHPRGGEGEGSERLASPGRASGRALRSGVSRGLHALRETPKARPVSPCHASSLRCATLESLLQLVVLLALAFLRLPLWCVAFLG